MFWARAVAARRSAALALVVSAPQLGGGGAGGAVGALVAGSGADAGWAGGGASGLDAAEAGAAGGGAVYVELLHKTGNMCY